MTSDTNDNRRLTWNAAGGDGGGEMTKTNQKKAKKKQQNNKSQVEASSLKLITIVH